MRVWFLRIGMLVIAFLLALCAGTVGAETPTPPPTMTVTPTSQPAPPILVYPPEGAVLTQPITVQDVRFISTGFVTYITVTGPDFSARWCVELHIECYDWDFENGDVPLPDGVYHWKVLTVKLIASAISEVGHFRVEIDDSHQLPPMLTATPQPTVTPTPRGR